MQGVSDQNKENRGRVKWISLLCCPVAWICKSQHSYNGSFSLFCFVNEISARARAHTHKQTHVASPIVSYSYLIIMVSLFVRPPFWYIHKTITRTMVPKPLKSMERNPKSQLGNLMKKLMLWKPSRSAIPAAKRVRVMPLEKLLEVPIHGSLIF